MVKNGGIKGEEKRNTLKGRGTIKKNDVKEKRQER